MQISFDVSFQYIHPFLSRDDRIAIEIRCPLLGSGGQIPKRKLVLSPNKLTRQPGSFHGGISGAELLDFPPAPKLAWDGKLDPKKASPQELHGQEIFFGKAQCASCHQPPYYTDNTVHNLQADRFYKQHMVNGMMMASDGPTKTFPQRGIKDTPPYLHDGRLLTLEDTVEYFNLVLDRKLTGQEKTDVVAFLRAL